MGPSARRRFLRTCASLVGVTIAGCADATRRDSSPGTDDEPGPGADDELGPGTDDESGPGTDDEPDSDDYFTDVTVQDVRLAVDVEVSTSIVYYEDEDDPAVDRRMPYVVDEDDADALRFRYEGPEVDETLTFLRETEFDEETVLIAESEVSPCYRWAIQYVERRSGDRLAPQLCQVKRDPDLECSLDGDPVVQVTAIRVPVAFDRPPSGSGQGRSSGCRPPLDHPVREPAGDGE